MEFDESLRRSLETNAENAKSYFSKTYEVREKMSALVGRATSTDGRISVGCTGNGGLTELQIDPRALKMGAADLSRTILELAGEAQADLERQGQEILQATFGDQNPRRCSATGRSSPRACARWARHSPARCPTR
ncbi:MAG: YbaB/EbfC family nucleoid-associated protein [Actinoallomurus sp.]